MWVPILLLLLLILQVSASQEDWQRIKDCYDKMYQLNTEATELAIHVLSSGDEDEKMYQTGVSVFAEHTVPLAEALVAIQQGIQLADRFIDASQHHGVKQEGEGGGKDS